MHLVEMPADGLYRAGRWTDVETFPPASQRIPLARPVNDGYRWEDILGSFATAKCSASAEGAIGRVIARYRRREVEDGAGIIDSIMKFMSHAPDGDEPEIVDGRVPVDVFADLYLISIPQDTDVTFVDLAHEDTHRVLQEQLASTLETLGLPPVDGSFITAADRRMTRLAMRALWGLCASGQYGQVAGIRYPGQPDPEWEAFVLWSPPESVRLTGDEVGFRWIGAWDEDAEAAAARLGLEMPD